MRRDGPWRGVNELELATLTWVFWFNEIRLHPPSATPTKYETEYYRHRQPQQLQLPGKPGLH